MNGAYVVTGPTSGIGQAAAVELSKYGPLILVGRDRLKLERLQKEIERSGQRAISVVCDLSDVASARRAAREITELNLPIAAVLNNAGIMQSQGSTRNALGWDMSFATNYLGPFAFTEVLIPHLSDGTRVLFVVSAVEDPERRPAVAAGFRGSRYLSVEASVRGEWKSGGSGKPGFDAYATSKQAVLAAALALAREMPRLRFCAIEPGVSPTTGLGGATGFLRLLQRFVFPLLVPLFLPFIKILSTPKRAARVISGILTAPSGVSGIYYDEGGQPMQGSRQVRDPEFQNRVVAETRNFLRKIL